MSSEEMDRLLGVLHELKTKMAHYTEIREPLVAKISDYRNEEKLLNERIRKLSVARFDAEGELHKISRELDNLPERLRKLELEINAQHLKDQAQQNLNRDLAKFNELSLNASWRAENRTDGLGAKHHQIDGGYQLALEKGGYLFDKRGLGKSLTSLITADLLDIKKLIIITPNEVSSGFLKQVNRWTPHRTTVAMYQKDPFERQMMFNILKQTNEWTIIINIEAWRRDWAIIDSLIELQAEAVVVDEAHNINKTELKMWQGIWRLIRGVPNLCPLCGHSDIQYEPKVHTVICKLCSNMGDWYEHKFVKSQFDWLSVKVPILMTGSPILNRPQDLYPMLRIVQPDVFYVESEYVREYCQHISGTRFKWKPFGKERLFKLIGNKLVMRDRKSAGVEIPDQQILIHELTLDSEKYPRQAAALAQIKDFAQLIMNEAGDTMNITAFITLLLRMRQGIVWPAGITLTHKDPEDASKIISKQQLEVYESYKLDWIFDMASTLVLDDERVLIFSQFNEPLYELERRFKRAGTSAVVLNGLTPRWLAEEIKADFDPDQLGDAEPKYRVALIQYKKGGAGLNLQLATQTIICDEEWNPGKADQAFGRNDRMGQTMRTQVHIPRIINSVGDMFMANLMDEKSEMVDDFDTTASQMMRKFKDGLDDKGMM